MFRAALIKRWLMDPRISTELVDHLPASATVPTPLKFHGRIVGTPGELTYSKDINRYFEALDKASDRVSVWNIGKSEEGRDMIVLMSFVSFPGNSRSVNLRTISRSVMIPTTSSRSFNTKTLLTAFSTMS